MLYSVCVCVDIYITCTACSAAAQLKHTVCSDDSLSPLESISFDDKSPLLVVGDGSDCGPPPPCEEEKRIGTLTFDDELIPSALVVINPFVTDVSVLPVVVDCVNPLAADVLAAPRGLVWSGRIA